MGGQEPSPPRALQTAETVLVLFLREKGRELPLCFLESSLGCVVQNGLTMGAGVKAGGPAGGWGSGSREEGLSGLECGGWTGWDQWQVGTRGKMS